MLSISTSRSIRSRLASSSGSLRDDVEADLHFEIDGGPFEWRKFKVPHITGKVDWVGQHLALSDIRASFYQGICVGRAGFDFIKGNGANFHFDIHGAVGGKQSLQLFRTDRHIGTDHYQAASGS